MVGLAQGSLDETAARIQNVGADILFQAPDASAFLAVSAGVLPSGSNLSLRETPGVAEVAGVLVNNVTHLKDKNKFVMMFGINPETYNRIGKGLEIVEGRGLEKSGDLLVDTVLAQADQIQVGDKLQIMNRDFEVVGIPRAGAGVRIYMGLEDMQTSTAQPGDVSFFFVKTKEGEEVSQVVGELEKRFEGYKVTALEFLSETMKENALGLKEFIRALSAFAALISCLVILLAMYTTIIERTREIGILKALGASRGYILKVVMAESFLICVMGVGAGFLLSVLGRSALLHFFPTLTVDLIPRWFLFSAIMGIGGGLIGALYPAYRAAKLDPVEALNFE